MKYVYAVMYAFKENGGLTFGYGEVRISAKIDCCEDLERIADNIAKGVKPDKGTKVVILNYVLLRKEKLCMEQEGER